MKKLLLAFAIMSIASISAKAQFFTGVSFDVEWANSGVNSTTSQTKSNITSSYSGTVSPQLGYKFSPKFMVGARLNFVFDKTHFTLDDDKNKYLTSSMGWDVAPFCRYRLFELGNNGWFSVWADLHTYYGTMYPTHEQEEGYIKVDFNRKHIYGVQAMPAIAFKINEKTSIFVNLAMISLAYAGTSTIYDDRTEYENNVSLFTMKLSGLFSAMSSEGMYSVKFGMVRTF